MAKIVHPQESREGGRGGPAEGGGGGGVTLRGRGEVRARACAGKYAIRLCSGSTKALLKLC